jgi:hypothetical protein
LLLGKFFEGPDVNLIRTGDLDNPFADLVIDRDLIHDAANPELRAPVMILTYDV